MGEITDELINKGKELADMACQKSLELVERAKIHMKIQDSKMRVKDSYVELGKIMYDLIKNGTVVPDGRAKILVSDVDSANYRIKLLNRELCVLKGAKVCAECGSLNPINSKFCSECAASLK